MCARSRADEVGKRERCGRVEELEGRARSFRGERRRQQGCRMRHDSRQGFQPLQPLASADRPDCRERSLPRHGMAELRFHLVRARKRSEHLYSLVHELREVTLLRLLDWNQSCKTGTGFRQSPPSGWSPPVQPAASSFHHRDAGGFRKGIRVSQNGHVPEFSGQDQAAAAEPTSIRHPQFAGSAGSSAALRFILRCGCLIHFHARIDAEARSRDLLSNTAKCIEQQIQASERGAGVGEYRWHHLSG